MTRSMGVAARIGCGVAAGVVAGGVLIAQGVASNPALALQPCAVPSGAQHIAAECGTLTVPENRSIKGGRTIEIAFAVLRSSAPGTRRALFMFTGGPGQPGTSMAGTATGWAGPVRADQDIVLIDQRGTGLSNPLNCPRRAASNPAAAFGHVYDPEWVKACRAGLEAQADLTQYTTINAVEDTEEIRQRLGYEKIALFGVSYGTRMAQAYLRAHPDKVSAVVIDGVVPFEGSGPLTYAKSMQQSLERVFAACAGIPECSSTSPRPAADFAALVDKVRAAPVETTVKSASGEVVKVKMNAGDLLYAIRGMLYNAPWQMLEMVHHAAETGDVSPIAQRYLDRQARIEGTQTLGLHFSVLCPEDVNVATEQDIVKATSGTFLGRYLFDEYRGACSLWPRSEDARVDRSPVTARVPVLLVSGFLDPVTPPELAERVAQSLPLSRTIVVPMNGHGSASGCPRAAALHLLTKGTFEGMPEVCKQ